MLIIIPNSYQNCNENVCCTQELSLLMCTQIFNAGSIWIFFSQTSIEYIYTDSFGEWTLVQHLKYLILFSRQFGILRNITG